MTDLGYEMVSHSANGTGVIFKKTGEAVGLATEEVVTILKPDYVGSDGRTPAYERDYVMDLLMMFSGHSPDAVRLIVAKRERN